MTEKDLKILQNGAWKQDLKNKNKYTTIDIGCSYDKYKKNVLCLEYKTDHWEFYNKTTKGKPGYLNYNVVGNSIDEVLDKYIELNKQYSLKRWEEENKELLDSIDKYEKEVGIENIYRYTYVVFIKDIYGIKNYLTKSLYNKKFNSFEDIKTYLSTDENSAYKFSTEIKADKIKSKIEKFDSSVEVMKI